MTAKNKSAKLQAIKQAAKIDWNLIFLNGIAPMIQAAGAQVIVELLEKLKDKDRKTILVALYGPVDVQLEDLTTKSKTKLDDAIVGAIKSAIEASADLHDIDLPNLDTD